MVAEAAPGFLKRPDHYVEIIASSNTFEVEYNGTVIASSSSVLEMKEKGYPSRYYFPKEHINMAHMRSTDHSTYCPFKGRAHYWTIDLGGKHLENGAWGYAAPYAECLDLINHVCFYLEKSELNLHTKE